MRSITEDDWPREETDHLFSLAHQYDLRFIIMADRWDYPSERTVEVRLAFFPVQTRESRTNACRVFLQDLKARYYSVCRTLVMQRPTQDESVRKATLATLSFDKGSFRSLPLPLSLRPILTQPHFSPRTRPQSLPPFAPLAHPRPNRRRRFPLHRISPPRTILQQDRR